MTNRRRTPTVLALLVTGSLALSACGGDGEEAAAPTAEGGVDLVQDGTLVTCTHLPYEPFQFQQGDEIVGFDVDIVDEIAADLGVEQQIIDTPFETIQSGEDLNAGKCDLAAAGMTITEVREENLDFSDPYFEATQALLTRTDAGYDSLDDLAGQRLGIQSGTTGAEYAQENATEAELVTYEDLGLLLAAVQSGQVEAGINDNSVLYDFVADNPDVEVTAEFETGEQYGIGIRTDNTALLEQVNATLERIQSDGTYDTIYEEWFGTTPTS